MEEEEDVFTSGLTSMISGIITPNTPVEEDKIRGSHTFNVNNSVFNLTKTKQNRKSKRRIVSEVSEPNNKSDFYTGQRQS